MGEHAYLMSLENTSDQQLNSLDYNYEQESSGKNGALREFQQFLDPNVLEDEDFQVNEKIVEQLARDYKFAGAVQYDRLDEIGPNEWRN